MTKPESSRNATPNDLTNRDIFTREERRLFLRSVNDMEKLIAFRLGFYGGLRISEITSLTLNDFIDSPGLPPVIHIRESKGGKSRWACIDECTMQMATCFTENASLPLIRVSDRTLQRWFKDTLEASGITRINARTIFS